MKHFPALVGIIFVLLALAYAFAFQKPTPPQVYFLLALCSVAGGGFGGEIAGFIKTDLTLSSKLTISAAGAFAIFVLLYLFVPATDSTMTENSVGRWLGDFIAMILFPAVWLIIAKRIPSLRKRPGVSYGVAIGVLWWVIVVGTPTVGRVLAGLMVSVILFANYRREIRTASKL
jgi:hypothetical protein